MALIQVGSDYPTIQAAVDAAKPGDDIFVEDGVYHEQVIVSTNFIKITGGKKTILDGKMKLDTGIILNTTCGVEIKSLMIKNYRSDGIDILGNGNFNTITQTHLLKLNYNGIFLDSASFSNKINGCMVRGAGYGVFDAGSYLCIEDSKILYCATAIQCETGSNYPFIRRCSIHSNIAGIRIRGNRGRIIDNDVYKSRGAGILAYSSCLIENNEVTGCGDGIYLEENSIAKGNRVHSNNDRGIYVQSNFNTLTDNEINDNGKVGILLLSEGNTLLGNKTEGNGNYDIVRVRANNTLYNNICGNSLPPWICDNTISQEVGSSNAIFSQTAFRIPSNFPTIQAAVDAANPGDIIWIENGVYHEQVLIAKNFIKIYGDKMAVLDGEMRLDTGIILNNTSGVEIISLTIKNYRCDGIDILGNGNGNSIANTRIFNINYFGVSLADGSSNNQITHSLIQGTYDGVEDRSKNLFLGESEISYCGNDGLHLFGSCTKVHQCTLSSNYQSGIESSGSDILIADSNVFHNSLSGIFVEGNSRIEKNQIYENGSIGISIYSSNCIVKDNQIWSNESYGIYGAIIFYENNFITGNLVNDNKFAGIVASNGCIVEGNTVQGNKRYDIMRREPNCIISNNVCGKSLPPWLCDRFSQIPEEEVIKYEFDCETVICTIKVPTDYPTIQAAVNAAFTGDIILVEDGVYHEEVVIAKSYIKLIGRHKVVLDGEMILDKGFTIQDASGVEIRSFLIKNYKVNGIVVIGNSNENKISKACILSAYTGILLESPGINNVISGCTVMGTAEGITNYSINLSLDNCRVCYNGISGILSRSENFSISGTTSNNNYGSGIISQTNKGISIITDNKTNENWYSGISVYGDCIITGNESIGNYSSGIYNSNGICIIKENEVCSNASDGIYVYADASVISNKAIGNGRDGINLVYRANFTQGNTVQDNEAYDIQGIYTDNIFRNNTCDKSLPPWICHECGSTILS